MAITFTNNWKKILDKLESVLRDEFKGSLKVYKGASANAGNQYLRLDPLGSELIDYMSHAETREFEIGISYHFRDANIKGASLDHILRYVSRIEALIHDNMIMTLDKGSDADNTQALNCRLDTCTLNQGEENEYLVVWDFKCQHTGNLD